MKKQMIMEQTSTGRTLILWLKAGTISGLDYYSGQDFGHAHYRKPDAALTAHVLQVLREEQRDAYLLPHPDYEETIEAIDRAITEWEQEEHRKGQLASFRLSDGERRMLQNCVETFRRNMGREDESFETSVLKQDLLALENALSFFVSVEIPMGDIEEWLRDGTAMPISIVKQFLTQSK
jgi:hypothetical protein